MFEVTKAEEEEKGNNSPPASPNTGSNISEYCNRLSKRNF